MHAITCNCIQLHRTKHENEIAQITGSLLVRGKNFYAFWRVKDSTGKTKAASITKHRTWDATKSTSDAATGMTNDWSNLAEVIIYGQRNSLDRRR